MTDVTQAQTTAVARPLKVLVPLIKKDLEEIHEAEQQAGMEHKRHCGELMIEAKAQLSRGEFMPWIKRNFPNISHRYATEWMNLAHVTETGTPIPISIREVVEKTRNNPNYGKPASWQQPVREALGNVDMKLMNLRKAEMARQEERALERKLALQLIDIGYKALATKLHPDKGGSRDAMARLNTVRNRLRSQA